jgi:hypothetical protein
MNDEDKREQLRERIEAAEARQQAREQDKHAAEDQITSFAREHPLLLLAGGLTIGVALSALVPRSPTRKLSKKTVALLGAIAEFGISYGREAMDAAEEAGRQGKAKLVELRGGAKGETADRIEEEPAEVAD